MPNKPRPRCPTCNYAMAPVFRKRPRGDTYARVDDVFWCEDCEKLARGRTEEVAFL